MNGAKILYPWHVRDRKHVRKRNIYIQVFREESLHFSHLLASKIKIMFPAPEA